MGGGVQCPRAVTLGAWTLSFYSRYLLPGVPQLRRVFLGIQLGSS